jgi:hypothetical protein
MSFDFFYEFLNVSDFFHICFLFGYGVITAKTYLRFHYFEKINKKIKGNLSTAFTVYG